MLQEELLHSLGFLFADLEVVWRIQVDQREGFHRALHVKAVPVDHIDSFGTRLFGPASVQFNAVPQDPFIRGDFSERSTIPDARIEYATLFVRECQESTDPLRLWDWKRVKPQTLTSGKAHRKPPVSVARIPPKSNLVRLGHQLRDCKFQFVGQRHFLDLACQPEVQQPLSWFTLSFDHNHQTWIVQA